MTVVLNRNEFKEWIRALIGGLLFALVVGVVVLLLTFKEPPSSGLAFLLHVALDLPGIYLHTWLFGDPFAELLPPAEALAGTWRIIWLTLVCWFYFGFVLTYFIKDNKKVIAGLFLMIMVFAGLFII